MFSGVRVVNSTVLCLRSFEGYGLSGSNVRLMQGTKHTTVHGAYHWPLQDGQDTFGTGVCYTDGKSAGR